MTAFRIIVPTVVAALLAGVVPVAAEPASRHAKGSFDVSTKPVEQDKGDGSTLGRFSLDKTYHGALEASGRGQMLTVGTEIPGSAVYVATERVVGNLDGKAGSFALVHRGSMRGKDLSLIIDIVPDSGSGALKGIAGRLAITVVDGKHQYDLEYTLPQ
ncbi:MULTISPECIES: DUF3224 domain-containing protein [Caulobacter]|jgi:hypothetical protein|uniref:DUF3224 domain-containing protein n=1 Tax=Caulobacter vibrioides OR37 TaxID=1292034 RepID=R0E850_CAUVI|nr:MULTISPECIES: DUF3224 domain-containing protein [Caulobacter]ENZ81653.1 hypothetical protein OR37_02413 [Caulobacter vibrioides OR37]MBQ1562427.1 DUF3224 domain-containing protein [Caulobacter sp.]